MNLPRKRIGVIIFPLMPNARAKGRGRNKLGEKHQSVTPRPLERRVRLPYWEMTPGLHGYCSLHFHAVTAVCRLAPKPPYELRITIQRCYGVVRNLTAPYRTVFLLLIGRIKFCNGLFNRGTYAGPIDNLVTVQHG